MCKYCFAVALYAFELIVKRPRRKGEKIYLPQIIALYALLVLEDREIHICSCADVSWKGEHARTKKEILDKPNSGLVGWLLFVGHSAT